MTLYNFSEDVILHILWAIVGFLLLTININLHGSQEITNRKPSKDL